MWKLDELETEISDKRFWAWRLHGFYVRRVQSEAPRGLLEQEISSVYRKIGNETIRPSSGAYRVRQRRANDRCGDVEKRTKTEDGRALTVSSQWPLIRRLSTAPRILLEETIWAAYRMYENEDRRVARQVLRHECLPDEMLRNIIEFI